ncbi:alpha-keto acid decarboxylase family protein [Oceanobacter kriegii]|uniref:alpha-keto acid decarboxylase family protein n=1 Tax=Oceanobacter kriegii TaxID=64972 RepID=UPI0004800147|nr:thiamine pyrophosphate-binding protein [Oceanobacter kriegii]
MPNSNSFTVADYLLVRMQQQGLAKVFQVPGDYVTGFMTALDNFDGIDAVGTVNELEAGYAADGYARYRGLGAVSVQYGVGTFSVLNAIAGSYVERNPVVVISASPSASDREIIAKTGALFHHSTGNLDADRTVFEAVTVCSEVLASATDAPAQIDRALTLALQHKRPIYLEAWSNVWAEPCAEPVGLLDTALRDTSETDLAEFVNPAFSRLSSAHQPLVILGIEVARYGLEDDVIALLIASGIPYTTTSLAKTVLDENATDVGFIGTYAGAASLQETADYVAQCDAILCLGAIFTDDYLDLLNNQYDDMIAVADSGTRIGNTPMKPVSLQSAIAGLLAQFENSPQFPIDPGSLPATDSYREEQPPADAVSYESFFNIWNQFVNTAPEHTPDSRAPKHGITTLLGESSSLYMAIRMNGMPQGSFVSDAAWGSLGHETACAIGVDMAGLTDVDGTSKRSVVIAGDGGFMMMSQALSTIKRNRLNSVVFVMSNGVYAIEQSFVNICAFSPSADFAPFDELPKWNYQQLAATWDIEYRAVEFNADLSHSLNAIQANPDKPYLIEIKLDRKDLAPAVRELADSINQHPFSDCYCDIAK